MRMRKRHPRWYFRWPGNFYAWGPTPEEYPSERAARAGLREVYKLSRLPRGTEVWRAA